MSQENQKKASTVEQFFEGVIVIIFICFVAYGIKYFADKKAVENCNDKGNVIRVIDGVNQCIAVDIRTPVKGDR